VHALVREALEDEIEGGLGEGHVLLRSGPPAYERSDRFEAGAGEGGLQRTFNSNV